MLYKRSAVPGWISQLEKLFYRINSYGVLWVHQVPQLLPCQHPASSGSAGPTDFSQTRISVSPSGNRAKNTGQSTEKKKRKKNSLFSAVNGGIRIPDISFLQQGSSDFLLAQPARYFWILAPEWRRELLTAPKPRASQWVNSEHLPWSVQPIPPWSMQEQWSCSKV